MYKQTNKQTRTSSGQKHCIVVQFTMMIPPLPPPSLRNILGSKLRE